MGLYKPGALIGSLSRRRFGLLIYVLIVAVIGVVASTQGKSWSVGVWVMIGLWLLVSIALIIRKTPN